MLPALFKRKSHAAPQTCFIDNIITEEDKDLVTQRLPLKHVTVAKSEHSVSDPKCCLKSNQQTPVVSTDTCMSSEMDQQNGTHNKLESVNKLRKSLLTNWQ